MTEQQKFFANMRDYLLTHTFIAERAIPVYDKINGSTIKRWIRPPEQFKVLEISSGNTWAFVSGGGWIEATYLNFTRTTKTQPGVVDKVVDKVGDIVGNIGDTLDNVTSGAVNLSKSGSIIMGLLPFIVVGLLIWFVIAYSKTKYINA